MVGMEQKATSLWQTIKLYCSAKFFRLATLEIRKTYNLNEIIYLVLTKIKLFYPFTQLSNGFFFWKNRNWYSFMLVIVLYQKIFVVCTHEAWSVALEIWYIWAYQVILHCKPTLRVHNTSFRVVLIEVL